MEQDEQIRELIAQGNLIAAIKLYREMTGVGLAEAKDAVEAIQRGEPVHPPPIPPDLQSNALLDEQIKRLLAKRQKIQAVNIYRETYNSSLKDAKDAVDAIEAQMRRVARNSLPTAPVISDDPFAEDTQRNRMFMALIITIVLVVIGGLAFFLVTGSGF